MKKLFLVLFLTCSCSQVTSVDPSKDEFDKILIVMKSKSVQDLFQYFGKPHETSTDPKKPDIQILRYKEPLIVAYINNSKKSLSHLTYFYWKEFDNYTALKKRFSKYGWKETKLPENKKGDVLTNLYLVKIPDINMEFQYDKNSPKRKVMWIYFD